MTATKLTALSQMNILATGGDLNAKTLPALVGHRLVMNTGSANETAEYTIESTWVSETDESLMGWAVRPGKTGGRHVKFVAK